MQEKCTNCGNAGRAVYLKTFCGKCGGSGFTFPPAAAALELPEPESIITNAVGMRPREPVLA